MSQDAAFLGLERVEQARFRLAPTPWIGLRDDRVHGGAALGAMMAAAEAVTGLRAMVGSAQYVAPLEHAGELTVAVDVQRAGRRFAALRATIERDGAVLAAGNITVAAHPHGHARVAMPETVPPESCRHRGGPIPPGAPVDSILTAVELRQAEGRTYEQLDGTPGRGRSLIWLRPRTHETTAATSVLAFLADFVLGHVSHALGVRAVGASLDNVLRVVDASAADWILSEGRVAATGPTSSHCELRLWSQHGQLLALGSQTVALRNEPPDAPRETPN